jgi:hypothetical protein
LVVWANTSALDEKLKELDAKIAAFKAAQEQAAKAAPEWCSTGLVTGTFSAVQSMPIGNLLPSWADDPIKAKAIADFMNGEIHPTEAQRIEVEIGAFVDGLLLASRIPSTPDLCEWIAAKIIGMRPADVAQAKRYAVEIVREMAGRSVAQSMPDPDKPARALSLEPI